MPHVSQPRAGHGGCHIGEGAAGSNDGPDHAGIEKTAGGRFSRNKEGSGGLSMVQGVILIPRRLRREILEGLHAGQGGVSMRARAANCVFWPRMDQAIQDVRKRCRTCDYIAYNILGF